MLGSQLVSNRPAPRLYLALQTVYVQFGAAGVPARQVWNPSTGAAVAPMQQRALSAIAGESGLRLAA